MDICHAKEYDSQAIEQKREAYAAIHKFSYMTAQREVNVLTDCETFIYAFRLAAKIMIDVLTEGQIREI